VAEQALVHGDADPGVLDLTALGPAAQLPGELADLGDRLRRDRLAERGQAATGIDGQPAAERGRAGAQQGLGLAFGAQADVLVPVQFEGGGQVVDLGER
jgi:hypothetical protein